MATFFSVDKFKFFGVFFRTATLVVKTLGSDCFVPHVWHLSFRPCKLRHVRKTGELQTCRENISKFSMIKAHIKLPSQKYILVSMVPKTHVKFCYGNTTKVVTAKKKSKFAC
jgi:hypothetical protein